MTQRNTTLSRHVTSEGIVVWTRCACGRLRMDLLPTAGGAPLTAGPCPRCHTGPDPLSPDRG
ncbi:MULTISPECIES: hypothetical protein [Actinomadura]|uniref:Uncharacterized protein n=1 Tax=Actinomadura livida TaxID=79909 RepID=A0A7W7IBT0_9ACTN|nr:MULTISPECIES: hypothetical protein [Actinomadura]MBB4774160.1 hypothetical protein [Actinomadura catellatispora]TDB93029.1 hypothetical protein E1266_22060 [Actinomadura sp. 7K534]GGT84446.1 hypothetical protein GCM10010208_03970 [Actinomadura livida]